MAPQLHAAAVELQVLDLARRPVDHGEAQLARLAGRLDPAGDELIDTGLGEIRLDENDRRSGLAQRQARLEADGSGELRAEGEPAPAARGLVEREGHARLPALPALLQVDGRRAAGELAAALDGEIAAIIGDG